MKQAYLIFYNLASALGWAYILFLTYVSVSKGHSAAEFWTHVGQPLTIVQTAAAMEVVHALIGFVRSPVFTTAMQVGSRLMLVWGFTIPYSASQAHWSLFLMVGSWAAVEVPRYLFYVCALVMDSSKIPFPLFWARYSLFMILYPSGISGEMLQMYSSLSQSVGIWHRFTIVLMILYLPGGPFMIQNMFSNRKRSFKKRAQAKNPRPLNGLVWPITNPKTEERSTSVTNKAIWAASIKDVDKAAYEKLQATRNWRFGYAKHAVQNVRISLKSSQNALKVAEAGLAAAHKSFQFIRNGEVTSLAEAMKKYTGSYKTGVIKGSKPRPKNPSLEVPYGGKDPSKPYYTFKNNDDVLTDDQLLTQLDQWVDYGAIEPSARDSIKEVVKNQGQWLDLSDKYFVLLGATSAMGPLELLLKYGANIIAVDLNRDFIWSKLLNKARASCGTLIFPYKSDKDYTELSDAELATVSGSNLLEDTPEICNWLKTVQPGKQLTVGNYTYLDGALHVQLSIACDAIMSGLCEARADTALAFLCTPTDCHVIPAQAHAAAKANLKSYPGWMKTLSSLSKKMLVPNTIPPVKTDSGSSIYIVDGLTVAQGPNYGLAKRMQHWRSVIARTRGHTVSTNIAPSTATKSVVHAAMFAAAYGSFHLFKPLEVMYQETSNAVMGALLIHDIRNPKSAANPAFKLENPYQLFEYGSFHGGVWRAGYQVGSIGEAAVMAYFFNKFKLQALAGIVGLSSTVVWVLNGNLF